MAMSLRLLLIEDSEDDALLVVRELCRGGFDPDLARVDTPQALKAALASGPWDAVISDYSMPAFTGLDALRIVRAQGLDLPFILVSGAIGEEKAVEAMKAGAHDYVMKDRLSRLAPALERELREAENRREQRRAEEELARYRSHLEALVRERTAELEEAKDAAEAANRAKSEFLTNISHEMRTPLTGVMGIIEFLLMDDLSAEQRTLLGMAHTSTEALKRLIEDILDFSRLAAGKTSFSLGAFDLRDCIRSASEVLALEAGAKGLRFTMEVGEDLPKELVSDEGRLRQVLVSLLGNAVKFTEAGEIHLAVRRLADPARPGQELLLCSIRDTGIGIPDGFQEKIFEKFTQVKTPATMKFAGCGLGLAISKQIIEHLGGKIWVESRSGAGSTFSFTIALHDADQLRCQSDQETVRNGCAPPGHASKPRPTAQDAFAFMAMVKARMAGAPPSRCNRQLLARETRPGTSHLLH